MGRQVNFWMTQIDERAFLDRLRRDDVVWTKYSLPLGTSPTMQELDLWKPVDEGQRIVIIRRSEWHLLRYKHIPEPPLHYDGAFTPWTLVGTDASPSFEWNCCVRNYRKIGRGRIYFKTTYLENNLVYFKPKEPTRWFDRLANWLRARGRKWNYNGQYIMPDAARLQDMKSIDVEVKPF